MNLQAACRLVSDATGIPASRIENEKAVAEYASQLVQGKSDPALRDAMEIILNHHNPRAAEVAPKG